MKKANTDMAKVDPNAATAVEDENHRDDSPLDPVPQESLQGA